MSSSSLVSFFIHLSWSCSLVCECKPCSACLSTSRAAQSTSSLLVWFSSKVWLLSSRSLLRKAEGMVVIVSDKVANTASKPSAPAKVVLSLSNDMEASTRHAARTRLVELRNFAYCRTLITTWTPLAFMNWILLSCRLITCKTRFITWSTSRTDEANGLRRRFSRCGMCSSSRLTKVLGPLCSLNLASDGLSVKLAVSFARCLCMRLSFSVLSRSALLSLTTSSVLNIVELVAGLTRAALAS